MKKKIINYLRTHIINIFVLLIFFVSFLFISNLFCQNYIHSILNNHPTINDIDYKDFIANYYQVQSDWLNRWLTFLGIMLASSGIAIPLLLNTSYKEKIKELQNETQKYKEASINQEKRINTLISSFNKDYNKKISEFRKEMRNAIEQAETDSVLIKIESLRKDRERLDTKGLKEASFEKTNEIIELAKKSLNKYTNELFNYKLYNFLESEHYNRGLYYTYIQKDIFKAISDYEEASHYNKLSSIEDSYTLLRLLLECYIKTNQYPKASKILSKISKINKEDLDKQLIRILEEDNDKEAKNLLIELQKKTVD